MQGPVRLGWECRLAPVTGEHPGSCRHCVHVGHQVLCDELLLYSCCAGGEVGVQTGLYARAEMDLVAEMGSWLACCFQNGHVPLLSDPGFPGTPALWAHACTVRYHLPPGILRAARPAQDSCDC